MCWHTSLKSRLRVYMAQAFQRLFIDQRGHQRGIDGMSAPDYIAVAVQLGIFPGTKPSPLHAQPLAQAPDGVTVRHVHRVLQLAKALVARAIEQLVLHLLVQEVLQALKDQDAHHHLGEVAGAPLLPSPRSMRASTSRASSHKSMCGTITCSGFPIASRLCWREALANRSNLSALRREIMATNWSACLGNEGAAGF